MIWFLVGLAGGTGAVVRFLLDRWLTSRVRTSWPFATLAINVSGTFLLGLLTGWCATHQGWEAWQTVVGTGLLGGYTTFSAASVEVGRLLRDKRTLLASVYAAAMLVVCVLAAGLGWALAA